MTCKNPDIGFHYYFYAPFAGAGNVIKSSHDDNAVITRIKQLDNDPAAAHIFFRLNLERHFDAEIARSIMVGFENSPPGRKSASGQAHDIKSVTSRNDRSAAATGGKWKALEGNVVKSKKGFVGVPHENGGRAININADRDKILDLFAKADQFVADLQENKNNAYINLWEMLLSEHQSHRISIAENLGVNTSKMLDFDFVSDEVMKHRSSKHRFNLQSICYYDSYQPEAQKRFKKNASTCKAMFKAGIEYVFHYVEWLNTGKVDNLFSAQDRYLTLILKYHKDNPSKNIPYFESIRL